MARKKAQPVEQAPASAQRGRPPLPPKTALARWIRDHGLTVSAFAAQLAEATGQVQLPGRTTLSRRAAPNAKTLLDGVNGRHWPSPAAMLLIRHVTKGEIDLEHWVSDLYL